VLLAPVALVVTIFLGAIAVDRSALFVARRSLSDEAAAAANDSVSAAFDTDAFTRTGAIRIDPGAADVAARASIAAQRHGDAGQVSIAVSVATRLGLSGVVIPTVTVTLRTRAPGIFLRGTTEITATASAEPSVAA
jgi:hypothetical protein